MASSRDERVSRLMQSVPSAPTADSSYVAKLLAEEASRRRQAYNNIGISAYTTSLPSTAPKEVNKTFLANTIRDIDSHNRREEIDDCWRAHRLQEKNMATTTREELHRKRMTDRISQQDRLSHQGSTNSADDDDERARWANLKAKKMKTQHLDQDLNEVPFVPSSTLLADVSISSSSKEIDKSRKKHKHKHKRKKNDDGKDKQKKKKKKDKKSSDRKIIKNPEEKIDDACQCDSSGVRS